jgi:hypothetical protein
MISSISAIIKLVKIKAFLNQFESLISKKQDECLSNEAGNSTAFIALI